LLFPPLLFFFFTFSSCYFEDVARTGTARARTRKQKLELDMFVHTRMSRGLAGMDAMCLGWKPRHGGNNAEQRKSKRSDNDWHGAECSRFEASLFDRGRGKIKKGFYLF
jgi:hypothetical protein